MIGYLSGILIEKQLPWVLIDINGVGYEVQVPMTTGIDLPMLGQKVILFTHFVVREDAQLLYGFHTKSLREAFRQLIKINGIGPKIGLAVLSGLDESSLKRAITHKEISTLSQIPGIGKKTAERLIIELQDKLDHIVFDLPSGESAKSMGINLSQEPSAIQDAISALISLGYKPLDSKKLIDSVVTDQEASSEELIKRALKAIMK